ncbi:MAG TPA: hypothetical protein ENK07_06580 [Bacteroidetes bacterium]|nr:hypothetical protein [Bacteroidota bacterium]
MDNVFYKALMAGVGALSLTREKAEAFVDELVKKGEVSRPEKMKVVDDLLKKAEQEERQILEKLGKVVTKALQEMDLPTKEDLRRIEEKLDRIEKQLQA